MHLFRRTQARAEGSEHGILSRGLFQCTLEQTLSKSELYSNCYGNSKRAVPPADTSMEQLKLE
jgi:hypothetical protein